MLEKGQVEPTTAEAGAALPRPRAARAHLAAAALRRHWLAAVLLAAGLVLRVLAQVAYRPVLFYIDTARYLYNDAPGMDPVSSATMARVSSVLPSSMMINSQSRKVCAAIDANASGRKAARLYVGSTMLTRGVVMELVSSFKSQVSS